MGKTGQFRRIWKSIKIWKKDKIGAWANGQY